MVANSTALNIVLLAVHSNPLDRIGTAKNGGMSIYLLQSARELGRLGHKVDVFTCNTRPGAPVVDEPYDNVRIIGLVPAPPAVTGSSSVHGAFCAALIRDYCSRNSLVYNLVHSHYWLSGVAGQILRTTWNTPHLFTFHTRARAKLAARDGHREEPVRLDTEDELLEGCDLLIASTEREAEELAEQAHDGPARIRVVGCGVDLGRFCLPAEPGTAAGPAPSRGSRLLFVGRFDPMKNITLLLDSLVHLDGSIGVRFLGGGEPGDAECERVLSLARERSVHDRIEMYGPVANERITACYHGADAVVVSSSYESFGLVVLEALACGTPVVSTPVGIAAQVIQDGFNGYLADPTDPVRFAEAIQCALELSRNCNPAAIRETVVEFGWTRVAESLLDVYCEL